MDVVDISLKGQFKNIFIIRRTIDVATKFDAIDIKTKTNKTIDKCKLMKDKHQDDYNNLIKLDNKNLIKYEDVMVEENFVYFISVKTYATELYDYLYNLKTLKKLLDMKNAYDYACQIVCGVEFLHSKNILHSYLNTTDIYVCNDDMIKIGGFYFAESLPSYDAVSQVKDRKLFFNCPPDEKKNISLKYDIWCIGWIIYEMCTLNSMKNILQEADFYSFNRTKIPQDEYKKLDNTYMNLTKLNKDDRKHLKNILNEKNFLGEQYMSYQNMNRRFEMVGSLLVHKDLRIKIEKILGSGAFGVAFSCIDLSDNSTKAIKLLNDMTDESTQAKLLMELNHKNIAKCFRYFFQDNKFYLLTEYCNANDLEGYITKTKNNELTIPINRVIDWSRQLFDALSYAHAKQIMHRDLKPPNVMLNYDPNKNEYLIKLIDFGLSRKLSKNLQASTFCGSPCYMAPEVFDQNYNFKADVWSAGCIVYEMSELKKAYMASEMHQLTIKIQRDKPTIHPSNKMIDVLNMIFIHDPNHRANSREIFEKLKMMKA